MNIHLLSLPHTATTRHYTWCAYTEKIRKFADICTLLGHDVYLYAAEDNEAKVTELIPIVHPEDWEQWWPGEDWSVNMFPTWDVQAPFWFAYNTRTIDEIQKRISPGDVIAVSGGTSHQPITDAFPHYLAIEWAVGYEGIYTSHRVFESYAWASHLYGKRQLSGVWYDAVIPNWFQTQDFSPTTNPSRDYLLFMGRRIENKGIQLCGQLAKKLGIPLLVAGQGTVLASEPDDKNVTYLGLVRGQERIDLFANALATLVPTYYIEPFGGVAVESMLCGTPAITSDWGAFPETVNHGLSGFRCRTFAEFQEAVRRAPELDPIKIRDWALNRYTEEAVAPLWARYFDRLQTAMDPQGWYAEHPVENFLADTVQ